MSFDPSRTQRVWVEIERNARSGSTDKHQSFQLLMHVIENLEDGVKDNADDIGKLRTEIIERLDAIASAQLTEGVVKGWIAGAFVADAQHRDQLAKKRYFARIFWKVIAPLCASLGTALSTLAHFLIAHWHEIWK